MERALELLHAMPAWPTSYRHHVQCSHLGVLAGRAVAEAVSLLDEIVGHRAGRDQLHLSHCRVRKGGQWREALSLLETMRGERIRPMPSASMLPSLLVSRGCGSVRSSCPLDAKRASYHADDSSLQHGHLCASPGGRGRSQCLRSWTRVEVLADRVSQCRPRSMCRRHTWR